MVKNKKWLVIWLACGLLMILVQVLLGGITRLTGSGLSITEWKPLMGILPPLNSSDWDIAFNKYKLIPQFKLVNTSMQLADFKWIFFWEWFHRFWARMLGFVFFIPFLYFLYHKMLTNQWIKLLVIAMLMGALQGLVGWVMVASGLKENVYVKHTNLTQHLLMACGLFAYMVWLIWKAIDEYKPNTRFSQFNTLKKPMLILMITVVLQLAYGGLMAGQHAAIDYPTYPLMNGKLVPDALINDSIPFFANFIDNKATIQWIHRALPWAIVSIVFYLYFKIDAIKITALERKIIHIMLAVIGIQIILGILTLVNSDQGSVPLVFGVLHQLMGVVFFIIVVSAYYHCKKKTVSSI
jgi:cytochrome c oxidase assembly protein subunit 15